MAGWVTHVIDGTNCTETPDGEEACERVARWKKGDAFLCKHHYSEHQERERREEKE